MGDLGWEDPLEEGMATHSSILPGESHGQRSLVGYGTKDHKEVYIYMIEASTYTQKPSIGEGKKTMYSYNKILLSNKEQEL